MATKASRSAARLMMAPAVILLLGWMLVPLIMTLWFSFRNYLPLRGGDLGFAGFDNYVRFVTSSSFWPAIVVGGPPSPRSRILGEPGRSEGLSHGVWNGGKSGSEKEEADQ